MAWVPLSVRAPKEWRKVEVAHSWFLLALFCFVLFYNGICGCWKKITCPIIFFHCHLNCVFAATEMTECMVYLCGRGGNYFNQLHFLALTLTFLFCKLSARGCSAGQKGRNFLTCNSYELLSIHLHALLEGDYSFLASTFSRTKITYNIHNLVTGDGSVLVYWESITHIYILIDEWFIIYIKHICVLYLYKRMMYIHIKH